MIWLEIFYPDIQIFRNIPDIVCMYTEVVMQSIVVHQHLRTIICGSRCTKNRSVKKGGNGFDYICSYPKISTTSDDVIELLRDHRFDVKKNCCTFFFSSTAYMSILDSQPRCEHALVLTCTCGFLTDAIRCALHSSLKLHSCIEEEK